MRFDDPAFGIQWPLAVTSMSDQDRNWPLTESPDQVLPKSSPEQHGEHVNQHANERGIHMMAVDTASSTTRS